MENFTLKGPRARLNPQDFSHKVWTSMDSIYKKDINGHYWPITCLQSVPHEGHPYYMPIDTPFVEEKEFLTFYLDYLVSLDAFRFVTPSWEREDMIKIEFDPTKVAYDYLAILNSLLRNCHAYWHVAYQFHKFSSWELNVDPLKLLVLAHYSPCFYTSYKYGPKPLVVSNGSSIHPRINGAGHSVIHSTLSFDLASPSIKLVNPFDSCNERKSKFRTKKQMKKNGYDYFIDPSTPFVFKGGGKVKKYEEYPEWLTEEQVKRILNV